MRKRKINYLAEKIDATLVDKLNNNQLANLVGGGNNAVPDGFHNAGLAKVHPRV